MASIIMAVTAIERVLPVFLLIPTLLLLAVTAQDAYIEIKQCPSEVTSRGVSEASGSPCVYNVDNDDAGTLQLNCQVLDASPAVSLQWVNDGGAMVNNTEINNKPGENGTVDSTATMKWPMTDVRDGMTFTCIAVGEAVGGTASKNVTIVVEDHEDILPLWLLIVIIVSSVVGLVLIVLCGLFLCKKGDRVCQCFGKKGSGYGKAPENEELLEMRNNLTQMREKLGKYKPEYVGTIDLRTDDLTIGFFGPSEAGKTELVNSLTFALQGGRYKTVRKPTDMPGEDTPPPAREQHTLTEHIRIIENHRSGAFEDQKEENANNIIGFDEEDGDEPSSKEEKIHCPVLVLNLRNVTRVGEESVQASRFSGKVKELYGPNRKVVITHKMSLEDAQGIATKMSLASGVATSDIFLVENYTPKSHKEDVERSLELLNFLWGCLEAGEKNLAQEIKTKTRDNLRNIVEVQAQQRR